MKVSKRKKIVYQHLAMMNYSREVFVLHIIIINSAFFQRRPARLREMLVGYYNLFVVIMDL